MDKIDKEEKIRNIGLQNLAKNSSIQSHSKKGVMLEETEKNVAFISFHKYNNTKFNKFGINNLFRTIYDYFILI